MNSVRSDVHIALAQIIHSCDYYVRLDVKHKTLNEVRFSHILSISIYKLPKLGSHLEQY